MPMKDVHAQQTEGAVDRPPLLADSVEVPFLIGPSMPVVDDEPGRVAAVGCVQHFVGAVVDYNAELACVNFYFGAFDVARVSVSRGNVHLRRYEVAQLGLEVPQDKALLQLILDLEALLQVCLELLSALIGRLAHPYLQGKNGLPGVVYLHSDPVQMPIQFSIRCYQGQNCVLPHKVNIFGGNAKTVVAAFLVQGMLPQGFDALSEQVDVHLLQICEAVLSLICDGFTRKGKNSQNYFTVPNVKIGSSRDSYALLWLQLISPPGMFSDLVSSHRVKLSSSSSACIRWLLLKDIYTHHYELRDSEDLLEDKLVKFAVLFDKIGGQVQSVSGLVTAAGGSKQNTLGDSIIIVLRSTMQGKPQRSRKTERFWDVVDLNERIQLETPKSGEYFYDYKLEEAAKEQDLLSDEEYHRKYKINFSDLPISQACIKGLTSRNFTKMTEIQRCVIPHALADRDVMAASRTGSGKTLCYLIPLIEKLYRHKFIPMDGLGAIVIVPVRQLAMQVFEVLNSFTANIEISVGLIIGGKNVEYEKQRIQNMNVLVCTPGRLLQHLEETYGFETSNLQMLVIDEADVMMEMGFESTLKSILQHLPKCQTMLFSATLSNQINLLANISMNNPEKVFLHAREKAADLDNKAVPEGGLYQTPAKLMQYYMIVEPEQKVNTLFSFLKTHQREKIIVFVSTCKQVRFLYESFRKFRLGLPMYELQGHQKQKKRMAIYFTFCEKKYGLLIATNIAARGLDFPMIDWVIQYDIAENTETYVHRIGRTARFKYEGKALTFVTQAEQPFVDELKQKNVRLHKIKQNPEKYMNIDRSLQSICSEHPDVKYLAQKALISYLKFVHKAANKNIFNIKNIDTAKLAQSYGLQNAPVVSIKNVKKQQSGSEEEGEKLTKIEKLRLKAKMKKNEIKDKKNRQVQRRPNQQEQNEAQPERAQSQRKFQKKKQKVSAEEKRQIRRKQLIKDVFDMQEYPASQPAAPKAKKSQAAQAQQQQEGLLRVKSKLKYDESQKPILTVSKNRMKKIRNEGLFDGKNKIHFDDDLNPITDEEYLRQQHLKDNEKNIHIERDFSNKILQNKSLDEEIEKKRRKEKRSKIKDQQKLARGEILPERSKLKAQLAFQSDQEGHAQLDVEEDD